ncbi:hypothetical protein H2203_001610 [Taxawa tesnikishii (nom. ined.)]|nr:hypothetical protein H2203_001610 [Dothideales sp. JES 119]
MAFIREMEKATETYFDRPFGRRQLYLDSLGTHPDYQRRGAGSAHVRWGLDLAKEREYLAVTLLASDAGRPVYAHLGFETLANMTVQVEGEEESVTWTVMAYNVSAHLQSLA